MSVSWQKDTTQRGRERVCVCVRVCEREVERERVSVCVCIRNAYFESCEVGEALLTFQGSAGGHTRCVCCLQPQTETK